MRRITVPSVRMRLELILPDRRTAEDVARSLEPDNVGLPPLVKLIMKTEENRLIIEVSGPLEKLLTVKNTIEDILVSIQPILRDAFKNHE